MNWSDFQDELARRRDAGRSVEFWWRDDDATLASPSLKRLLVLSKNRQIPLALAVVPQSAEPELFALLHEEVSVLQHGTDHRNRAAPGEKKTEFPAHEPADAALERLAKGSARLKFLTEAKALPVLAPPWNRFRNELLKKLPSVGFRGLSAYGARSSAEPAPGLRQVNAHVDIVAWREGKRFIGEGEALALALRHFSGDEPVGWLTHHAVHDRAAWNFLERLFTLQGARWVSAAALFSYTAPAHG